MKELNMIRIEDMKDEPSEELKAKTLAAMRAVQERKSQKKAPAWRKFAVCTALFCSALVLMGAGVKVFEYLTFVPGMGIVTADQEKVYTLERVVEAGDYRIEAASMIPAEDEEYEGMWQVTVLTDMEVPHNWTESPDLIPPMILTTPENEYTLRCSGGSSVGARFTGYADIDGEGEYTLIRENESCIITMKSMENSIWANYSYPVSDGITAIAFPLTEGSEYLVFDVILEPQSKNMEFWASHCESILCTPRNVIVTDADGNRYSVNGGGSRSVWIPDSERDYGLNSLLSYKFETILSMDAPLAADVVSLEIDQIKLQFLNIGDIGNYTVTVPEIGEIVKGSDLPGNGVFLDLYGITSVFKEMYTGIDEQNNKYDIYFRADPETLDFEENVSGSFISIGYIEAQNAADAERWRYHGGGTEGYPVDEERTKFERLFSKDILGSGDRKNRSGTTQVTFGDEVTLRLNELWLYIDGNWTIDFTTPANTAE